MTKNGKDGPGRALVKSRNQLVREAKERHGTGRTNRVLESVTDVKDIEAVVEQAEEAGRVFSVDNPLPEFINLDLDSRDNAFTHEERKEQQKAEESLYADYIRIPRRPAWHANMSTEELDARERQSFLTWRRSLARLEENEKLVITPFEKNINIWRQLWRVLERSDLVVTVVDARNPLFYRCPDLEAYVREIDHHKRTMLLVNKADLLPFSIRLKWAKFFHSRGIFFLFWSAKAASVALEGKKSGGCSICCLESQEELQKSGLSGEDVKIHGREELLNHLQNEAEAISANRKESIQSNKQGQPIVNQFRNRDGAHSESGASLNNHNGLHSNSSHVVVGFVGYPNVGKSSTINALVGEKRTGVTSTPGKTKHFQTLIVTDRLMLCDCPGLVFPCFASSRHEMVASGVLPIDRITDNRGAIQAVLDCVPRTIFEDIYRINLPQPKPYEPKDRAPSAFELLRTYCHSRGYVGSGGLPDETRAARQILKDYIDGKLPHFELPPEQFDNMEDQFIEGSTAYLRQTKDSRMGLVEATSNVDDSQLGFHSTARGRLTDLSGQQSSSINGDLPKAAAEMKGHPLGVMCGSSLESVLNDLDSFDSTNGLKSVSAAEKKNRERNHTSHKMHKKPQRKKDRSWRVGNDDGDGMPSVQAVQKVVSYGAAKLC